MDARFIITLVVVLFQGNKDQEIFTTHSRMFSPKFNLIHQI